MAFLLDIDKKLAPIANKIEPQVQQFVNNTKKIPELVCLYAHRLYSLKYSNIVLMILRKFFGEDVKLLYPN